MSLIVKKTVSAGKKLSEDDSDVVMEIPMLLYGITTDGQKTCSLHYSFV